MIELRKMADVHVAQVAELEKICFRTPWSENSVASELKNPLSLWLVALDAETVIGYIGSQSVAGEADMMNVAVHPDYRRRGIAKRLVTALVAALKETDVHSLTLEVRVSNISAIGLYRQLGFIQAGLRPGYYRNPKEDAYILRKEWAL